MRWRLSQRLQIDAAHTLPRSDSSRRVHGHTYHLEVIVEGTPDAAGVVMDLDRLRGIADAVREALDHRLLDEVPGLLAPTLERIGEYVLTRHPELCAVRVWRTDGGCCEVTA